MIAETAKSGRVDIEHVGGLEKGLDAVDGLDLEQVENVLRGEAENETQEVIVFELECIAW